MFVVPAPDGRIPISHEKKRWLKPFSVGVYVEKDQGVGFLSRSPQNFPRCFRGHGLSPGRGWYGSLEPATHPGRPFESRIPERERERDDLSGQTTVVTIELGGLLLEG